MSEHNIFTTENLDFYFKQQQLKVFMKRKFLLHYVKELIKL